jgi:hypothetical protein
MKSKLKERLSETSTEQLLDILEALCDKNPSLEGEIDFLLNPKKILYPQSYYNRIVKKEIDTNSWSHFPNKGIKGLQICLAKAKLLVEVGNTQEAKKMAIAMEIIFKKCKQKYTVQNKEELKNLHYQVIKLF